MLSKSQQMFLLLIMTLSGIRVSARPVDTYSERLANKKSDPMNWALYIMIVIVCLLVFIMFGLCLFYRYCKQKRIKTTPKKEKTAAKSPAKRPPPPPPPAPHVEPQEPQQQQGEEPAKQHQVYSSYKEKIDKLLKKDTQPEAPKPETTQPKFEQKAEEIVDKPKSPVKDGKHKKAKKSEDSDTEETPKKRHKTSPKKKKKKSPKKEESEESSKGESGTPKKASKVGVRVKQIADQLKDEKPKENIEKKREWAEKQKKSQTPISTAKQTDTMDDTKSVAQPTATTYSNVEDKIQQLTPKD